MIKRDKTITLLHKSLRKISFTKMRQAVPTGMVSYTILILVGVLKFRTIASNIELVDNSFSCELVSFSGVFSDSASTSDEIKTGISEPSLTIDSAGSNFFLYSPSRRYKKG